MIRIGAHVSSAGGVDKALERAARIGSVLSIPSFCYAFLLSEQICNRANAFALFLKSQRQWKSKALPGEMISTLFPEGCKSECQRSSVASMLPSDLID